MNGTARRRAFRLAALVVAFGALFVVVSQRVAPRPALTHPAVAAPEAATEPTEPAEPTPAVAVASAVVPAAPSAPAFDEEELMRLLRSARDNDPALAAELAREGNRRFPQSPAAPERSSLLIHALAAQGLASAARGEAEDMVNRYPDSAWVREVEQFTGAHRRRNVRVDEQGHLRYFDAPPS